MTAGYRLTTGGVVRAEWSKLWSLRSFWIPLVCTIGGTAVLGALVSGAYRPGNAGQVDPVSIGLFGMKLATGVIAGLGIMSVTGEYSTGSIRSSMTAVPKRWPVLWSKAALLGTVMLGVFMVAVLAIFALSQSLLTGTDMRASLADPGVARTLVGLAVSAAYCGVLGVVIGAVLRSTPGAIGAYAGAVYVLPLLLGLLPWSWVPDAIEFLPGKAVEPLTELHPGAGAPPPLVSCGVMAGWVLLGLAAASALLDRRDV